MNKEKLKEVKETLNILLDFDFVDSIEVKINSSLKIIEQAINYTCCSEQLKDKYPKEFEEFAKTKANKQQVEHIYWYKDKSYWTKEHLYKWWTENKYNL